MLSVFLPSFFRSSSVCAVARAAAKSKAAAATKRLMVFLPGQEPSCCARRGPCTSGPGRARIPPHARPGGPMSQSQAVSMGIGPLATLGEEALKELAPHGSARAYPKNAVIINEGDETDSLYILLA